MTRAAPSMDELREMIAGLSRSQAETDRLLREADLRTDEQLAEAGRRIAEAGRRIEEVGAELRESDLRTDKQLEELGRQIGGLGDKFGSFTEGMAYPSMRQLLKQRFGMNVVFSQVNASRNGHNLEIDVLAYSNGDRDEAYVVEVKSHLREEGIQQMLRILEQAPELIPALRDKKLYGILAVISAPEELEARVLAQGIYLAQIRGDVFELQVPEDFQPRSFQKPASR